MSVIEDVDAYEDWLRKHCAVVRDGLRKKHKRMAEDAFRFFRATCFRFARKLPKLVPQLVIAPKVPSVGDAHLENWGTWRDIEGRLVWGVNDFDDAAELPFTFDLLRLAISAGLANRLPISIEEAAVAILSGYDRGLAAPGPQFVNDETIWLQTLVTRPATRPGAFRADLAKLDPDDLPPPAIAKVLKRRLPSGTTDVQFGSWQRGGGSLGRPRYVARGTLNGGPAVREAKALVPSSWDWAAGAKRGTSRFRQLATGRYRSPDPYLDVRSGYVFRRIAPDSTKINFGADDAGDFGRRVFEAMGADLAAIHLGDDEKRQRIRDGLARLPDDWLPRAAVEVAARVRNDFKVWRDYYEAGKVG